MNDHKPITDAQAKKAHDLCGRALDSNHVEPGGYADLLMGHVLHLLRDRDVAMGIIEGLHVSLLHAPPPEKAHEGSCHPDAGCDGLCAEAYAHDMLLDKARALIKAVRGGGMMPRRGIFGWSYPPGCTGPVNEEMFAPSELTESVLGLLEDAGVPTEINDKITKLIEGWEQTDDACYGCGDCDECDKRKEPRP